MEKGSQQRWELSLEQSLIQAKWKPVTMGFEPSRIDVQANIGEHEIYLMELDIGTVEAAVSISMISWAFIIGLPIGGYLAYRHNLPNSVMVIKTTSSW